MGLEASSVVVANPPHSAARGRPMTATNTVKSAIMEAAPNAPMANAKELVVSVIVRASLEAFLLSIERNQVEYIFPTSLYSITSSNVFVWSVLVSYLCLY